MNWKLQGFPLKCRGQIHVQITISYLDQSGNYQKTAKQCVKHFLKRYKSSFCYVFSSRADFSAAKVTKSGHFGGDLCYRATYGVAIAGNITNVKNNNALMQAFSCPSYKK